VQTGTQTLADNISSELADITVSNGQ